jgi:hypothetical protein
MLNSLIEFEVTLEDPLDFVYDIPLICGKLAPDENMSRPEETCCK